jgi:hypothetical protein
MLASLESLKIAAAAADIDKWSIHRLDAETMDANHQGWCFNMENPTSENCLKNRCANLLKRDVKSRFVDGTANNGKMHVASTEEEGDDETDEEDEPGVDGEFGEPEPEPEDDE